MLDAREVPLSELVSLTPTHSHVMLGLYRFADKKTGVCYPGLRRLAKEMSLAVRTLRRALEEMVELDHLTITKIKGRVNRYQIAARFLCTPPVSPARTPVSPLRTEGEAKEREDKVLKKEEGPRFGCASTVVADDQPVQTSNTQSRPDAVRAAPSLASTTTEDRPPPIGDCREAYKAGIKRRKREAWIGKLNGFVMRYFSGDFQGMMAHLEVVTRASNATHDWASLSKGDHKVLDWLDEHMRNWEAQGAIHARAA
jgi:hypothetical protein